MFSFIIKKSKFNAATVERWKKKSLVVKLTP